MWERAKTAALYALLIAGAVSGSVFGACLALYGWNLD